MGEESAAGIPQQVNDVIEAFGAPIVGIGDFPIAVMLAKVAHHFDFVVILPLGVEAEDVPVVVLIHGQDQVKGGEVGGGELAGGSHEGDALALGGGGHATIGGVAHMVAGGSGGVAGDEMV